MRLIGVLFAFSFSLFSSEAQTYETQYRRPVSEVMNDVAKRFNVKFKFDANVDTAGVMLTYADFRIRPYSVEETLKNICAPFDFVPWDQGKNVWKIKPYEYPRRKPEDGKKMIAYLNTLYNNKAEWELRRDSLRREVRQRLGIDSLLRLCLMQKNEFGPIRKHNGYTVQNFRLSTVNGHTICGSIYSPVALSWKKSKIE